MRFDSGQLLGRVPGGTGAVRGAEAERGCLLRKVQLKPLTLPPANMDMGGYLDYAFWFPMFLSV